MAKKSDSGKKATKDKSPKPKATKTTKAKTDGYDPSPFYKNVPDDYKAKKTVKKVTEIRGRPIAVTFDPETRTGDVTIEDITGKAHSAMITRARTFDTLVHYMGERGTGFEAKYKGAEKKEQTSLLTKMMTFKPPSPLLFRLAKVEDGDNKGKMYLYAVMSSKWTSELTAENSLDTVKEIVKKAGLKANIKMTESDGLHGGHIYITEKGNDGTIAASAHFDFGLFDNYHCVRGYAKGEILACSNLLTIEIKGAMKGLDVGVYASLSEMHVGSLEQFNELVGKTAEALGAYSTIIKSAQKVKVTREKMDMIVQYYADKKQISSRTQEKILKALDDKKIQQVSGTMYGLAMALTYVGTHDDELKDGVKRRLQTLGGELLVVSQDPKGYWNIIQKHHDNRPTPAPKPKAEKPTKKEKPAKAKKADKKKKPKGEEEPADEEEPAAEEKPVKKASKPKGKKSKPKKKK